jgi:tetratricopeptide (TPR) repeat protein
VSPADLTSTFNLNVNRDVVVLGPSEALDQVRRICGPLPFLNVTDARSLTTARTNVFFVLAVLDFSDLKAMQAVARAFQGIQTPLAQKVILAVGGTDLKREQLFFSVEIGARHVSFGPSREEELRAWFKRVCRELLEAGTIQQLESEVATAASRWDETALQTIHDKLVSAGRDTEDILRLLVTVNRHLRRPAREETYLKKLLQINPQNLWAANSLGKLYLRQSRAAEGIEILRRLSQFHDLNSERLLDLGTAWLNCGRHQEAEQSFQKGEQITGGADERFREGMAKVKLAGGDYKEALAITGKTGFSLDIVSFLNMRAILAIREGRLEEGLRCYQQAAEGFKEGDQVVLAKLKFNLGLGLIKANEPEKAVEMFEESRRLGGTSFKRASRPLEIARSIAKNKAAGKTSDKLAAKTASDPKAKSGIVIGEVDTTFDDLEWEQIE